MTLLDMHPHLHRTDAHEPLAMRTHRGQAHYACSGPPGRTCRECVFWQFEKRWSLKTGPQPAKCAKHRELMRGIWGQKVPHSAGACRHFEPRDKEIPLFKPEKP